MRVVDQTMTIHIYNTIRYMDNGEECHSLQDSVDTTTADDTELRYNSAIQIWDFMQLQESGMKFESLDFTEFVSPKSSLEIAPSLELKPLPSHLKYVFWVLMILYP
ncbi:hypothetical protein GQ457_12G015370 [Hibiscus cannabinus]